MFVQRRLKETRFKTKKRRKEEKKKKRKDINEE
jgi:hypothetical protein